MININNKLIKFLKILGIHHIWRLFLRPGRFIQDVFGYIRFLGLKKGIKLYNEINHVKGSEVIKINMPGYKHPIVLRKGTSDKNVFNQIFIKQEYNYNFGKDYNPNFIIDCGANIGYSTIYFANRFPDALIYAIEPETSNYNIILENISNYSNIKAFKKGIWHKKTNLEISNPSGRNWSFQVIETSKTEGTIPAITIDELMKKAGKEKIDVLKIDIEGSEKEVFENNSKKWLSSTSIIFLELHERYKKGVTKSILNIAKQYGYSKSISGENVVFKK